MFKQNWLLLMLAKPTSDNGKITITELIETLFADRVLDNLRAAQGIIQMGDKYGAQRLVVRVTDFGYPFQPSEPPAPDPEAMLSGKPGGIGLYFIYRSVDVVNYESTESGNTLTLLKNLDAGER